MAPVRSRSVVFTDLPAEIRNGIYKALWAGIVIELSFDANEDKCSRRADIIKKYTAPPGLTLLGTCRQVNDEAMPVFLRSCALELCCCCVESLDLLDPAHDFASLTATEHFPYRLRQAMQYIEVVTFHMKIADSIPDARGNRYSNWFPIRDRLACLPQLKQLRIIDFDATGTDYFLDLYDSHLSDTAKTKTSTLFDTTFFEVLSDHIQTMIQQDDSLKGVFQNESQKDKDKMMKIEMQMGLRLSWESEPTLLNGGYTSDDDLMVLNDWQPFMFYTYDLFDSPFSSVTYVISPWWKAARTEYTNLEEFMARVHQIQIRKQELLLDPRLYEVDEVERSG